MTATSTANERITHEVTSWPGVEAGTGSRGEFGFRVGSHEVGHLHERSAHFAFGRELGMRLRAEDRIVDHPVFPGKPGIGAQRIESDADVDEVIALMRLNYDRIVERFGLEDGGG
jgi:hypothetical protein